MTYCVGMLLKDGLVLAADTRTSAGVDHVASFRKLTVFEDAGERMIALMSAGNLATSQSVVTTVSERLGVRKGQQSLFKSKTMFNAARIVGRALREELEAEGESVRAAGADPGASFLVAGQIKGRPPRLFQVYEAGNFIEAAPETPFLQIGETKYGKPILDRIVRHDMSLADVAKVALLSFESTMRSNISVGPPIDLMLYRRDALNGGQRVQITAEDAYFNRLRTRYAEGILALFDSLEDPSWADEGAPKTPYAVEAPIAGPALPKTNVP